MESVTYIPDWAKQATIYHIYPFGFLGAPKYSREEDRTVNRLADLRNFYTHLQELEIDTIQFGPLFESVSHGYDTTDYFKIDRRLGTNELFKEIVDELHEQGIKVIVDGVFNHVGREFHSFKDARENRDHSQKKHWHYIDFSSNGNNPYNDGFDYKNWESHYSLVKLNLESRDVRYHVFSAARYWLQEIGIDGWRLDVAYLFSEDFLREFRRCCKAAKNDCFIVGEMIHGPYGKWIADDKLDAGTGYQVYKSIWSAINDHNMFELKHVLENSFHPQWGQNKNIVLMNFLGNHDTTRIASLLDDRRYLFPAFLLLFTLNGIPKIYYGDELGREGVRTKTSDEDIRKPMYKYRSEWPLQAGDIFNTVKQFIQLRKANHALIHGDIVPVFADNIDSNMLAYLRRSSEQTLLVIVSASFESKNIAISLWNQNLDGAVFVDILNNDSGSFTVRDNQLEIPEIYPCWGRILEKR
ncbi:MAG: alpha-amylase family glycosyl hydrolase [Candidatus Hodarchaeales archaeon]|jgi:glycosidase